MDVMKPDLMWIEGRCYRLNPILGRRDDEYCEEEYQTDIIECTTDEPCDEFDVEPLDGGRYRTSFHIARAFFPYLIGMKGNTKRRLENETKTQVKVPKQGQEGDIVITGFDRRGVCAARRRVNLIVMSARMKQTFTHFLSIPVNSRSIQEQFLKFKEDVLENCKSRGIEPSIFQVPEKLHITIATMVLMDREERKDASKVLQQCKDSVIDPLIEDKVIKLQMKGVEYMNDDPREVDILYGKIEFIDNSRVLQDLADGIVDFFVNFGCIMDKQYEKVKLHVTLMNTLFREDKGGVSDQEMSTRRHKPRESFDASELLKKYENYYFGEKEVNAIHLSQRYTTAENGYYQASYILSFY